MKLGNDTIVLVARTPTGERDSRGNEITTEVFTEVRWCSVTPGTSSESSDQSVPRVKGLQVLAPRGPADQLQAVDAVIYPPAAQSDPEQPWTGPRYEVAGDVGLWDEAVQAQLERLS